MFCMLTFDVVAAPAGEATRAAAASAHIRAMNFLRTSSLREGGGHGWLWLRTGGAGLLEHRSALGPGSEHQDDDPGEQGSAGDGDLAEAEDVAEVALEDGTDRVHDAEGDHVEAEDPGPQILRCS